MSEIKNGRVDLYGAEHLKCSHMGFKGLTSRILVPRGKASEQSACRRISALAAVNDSPAYSDSDAAARQSDRQNANAINELARRSAPQRSLCRDTTTTASSKTRLTSSLPDRDKKC